MDSYRFNVGNKFYVIEKHNFLTGKVGTIIEQRIKWGDMKSYLMSFEGLDMNCHIEEIELIKIAIKI